MQLFLPDNFPDVILNTNVVLDTDFLSLLFKNENVLQLFLSSFKGELLLLDSLSIFEFLRDMYVPEERKKREEFIKLDFFVPMTKNQQQVNQLDENALLLSKLYAHNAIKGASFVDLRLAARLLLYAERNYVLITGNKRHFPSCIFDIKCLITAFNSRDERFYNFPIIGINKEKLNRSFQILDQVMQSSR